MENKKLLLLGLFLLLLGSLLLLFGWKSNIDVLILIGAILIAIGAIIVRLAKKKKEAGKYGEKI